MKKFMDSKIKKNCFSNVVLSFRRHIPYSRKYGSPAPVICGILYGAFRTPQIITLDRQADRQADRQTDGVAVVLQIAALCCPPSTVVIVVLVCLAGSPAGGRWQV